MARKRYATVKIPFELATALDELVERFGYRSRAEIVNDAIRRFIETRKPLEEAAPSLAKHEAPSVLTA